MKTVLSTFAVVIPLFCAPAQAHKVIVSVYSGGDAIEGEIGFSNGDMAVDKLVVVFDEAGDKIGEVRTDADGFFVYTPVKAVKHVFKADLGAGHVAEVAMAADEVAGILGKAAPKSGIAADEAPAPKRISRPGGVVVASLSDEERDAIAKTVREETRSLRREIAAYKEKNDFQTILGGIGYIFGLFGLGFYLAARQKMKS